MKIIKIVLNLLLLGSCPIFLVPTNSQATPVNEYINLANEQLRQARETQKASRQLIVDANRIRKQLKTLRASQNRPDNFVETKQSSIAELIKQLEQKQQEGAELREQSKHLKRLAADNFEEGFVHHWQSKVTNRKPLTMDSNVESFFAHNTRIRSVHKNMPSSQETPAQDAQERPDMSLMVPSLMKQNAPPDLNINAFKFSRKEKLFAHIEVHQDTSTLNSETNGSTNVSAVPLNRIHRWRLMVTDLEGNPVKNIRFEVEGHMPGHVHGLPTAPRVTHELEPGVYIVDGMKFQMKGWWVMKFIVESEQNEYNNLKHADFFTFNLVL